MVSLISIAAAVTANPTTYSNYDAALYSATMYVAQQSNKTTTGTTPTTSAVGGVVVGPTGGGSATGNPNWQYKKAAGATGGAGQGTAQSHHNVAHNNSGGAAQSSGPGHHHHGGGKPRYKQPPKPQQLHYCEVCKISCAGPQTYREHLEGQKHKKREASLKLVSTATTASRGNNMHCELCDVACTGYDAFTAHVRGSKHQKVVKLHQKLGKPIPNTDPVAVRKMQKVNFVPETKASMAGGTDGAGGAATAVTDANATGQQPEAGAMAAQGDGTQGTTTTANEVDEEEIAFAMNAIKPVGMEFVEEVKEEDGKSISFNCKLCECKFNDPNAKEMHMKGRRHRLQYKKKVQPDLVVDAKPSPRRLKLAEARAQRAMQEEQWARRRSGNMMGPPGPDMMPDMDMGHWDDRRRFEEESDYWGNGPPQARGGNYGGPGVGPAPPMGPPIMPMGGRGMMPGAGFIGGGGVHQPYYVMAMHERRPDSNDDRHVVARHAEIYPKEEELQVIQRIVSHTERALKFVSDALTDPPVVAEPKVAEETAAGVASAGTGDGATAATTATSTKPKEDGRDNQMFSFLKEADGNVRVLKGVMRVGLLAKGEISKLICRIKAHELLTYDRLYIFYF